MQITRLSRMRLLGCVSRSPRRSCRCPTGSGRTTDLRFGVMTDELQTGEIPPRNTPEVATAANSTTLAVQLEAKRKAKLFAAGFGSLASVGMALGMLAVSNPVTIPVWVLIVGVGMFGVGSVGAAVSSAAAGAQLDEKSLSSIGDGVVKLLEAKKAADDKLKPPGV